MNTLIAYFTAGGVTGAVAKRMAEAVGAEAFEIRPQTPYSEADLNWKNPFSRCNKEKLGKKDVPIADKIENFDAYDRILIGFPIWYYGAPNIIQTFLQQYDFSGKKIALFATSGGSDISKTAARLKPFLSEKAEIIGSKLFQPDDSAETLTAWVNSL